MRRIETTLPTATYDALDREAGRQGISVAEAQRRAVACWMRECLRVRLTAEALRGDTLYSLPAREAPLDTGAWNGR